MYLKNTVCIFKGIKAAIFNIVAFSTGEKYVPQKAFFPIRADLFSQEFRCHGRQT